jgi:dTDP-4-dehydrorhamnose 3,5-epimerase
MLVTPMDVAQALVIVPNVFTDARGYFKETYSRDRYRQAGIPGEFVQDNLSVSAAGTLRGLHADARMAKLVQVLTGEAYDVVVDARLDSPTFGRWQGVMLRASEHTQLYIPAGCLHGFLAMIDGTTLSYKQTAAYDPAAEFGVIWNDPTLAIDWPLAGRTPLVSPKDEALPPFDKLRVTHPSSG